MTVKLALRSPFSHGWYATTALDLGGIWNHAGGGGHIRPGGARRLRRGGAAQGRAGVLSQHGPWRRQGGSGRGGVDDLALSPEQRPWRRGRRPLADDIGGIAVDGDG